MGLKTYSFDQWLEANPELKDLKCVVCYGNERATSYCTCCDGYITTPQLKQMYEQQLRKDQQLWNQWHGVNTNEKI